MATTIQPKTANKLFRMPDDGFCYERVKKMSPTGFQQRFIEKSQV